MSKNSFFFYCDLHSECTARPECRCPEGYFKTRDGTECLKFSEEPANCIEAERACSADFNSRLAIAKDQERLDKIATIMDGTEIKPTPTHNI